MMDLITSNLIWTQSPHLVIALASFGLLGLLTWRPIFYVCLILFAFSFYFFRNPERICPAALHDRELIIAPADGTIIDVAYDAKNSFEGYPHKLSIFLSPLDVHVMWTPIAGIVEKIQYVPGEFNCAFLPKSSLKNEHNDLLLKDTKGRYVLARQIAGIIARRICCWVTPGNQLTQGHKYGMIKFGSRVDIFLPENVRIQVGIGQTVRGGSTIIARWT